MLSVIQNRMKKKSRPYPYYFDYAATTPVDKRVLDVMLPYFTNHFGNTSSLHQVGQTANEAVENSREIFANALGVSKDEIYFTSSATESNNTVIKGIALTNRNKGNHIVISSIEHDCVLNSAKWLEKIDVDLSVTVLDVDKYGKVNPDDVKKAIKKETILASIMSANNEMGTIQEIAEIGEICHQKNVLFHTDASQSFGKTPIKVSKMNVDLLTASAHKIYGPRGAALLYFKKGIKLEPLLHGGGHESGMRSSTVNTAAIVGFAKAYELCEVEMEKESKRLSKLRDELIKGVLNIIPNSYLNGHPVERLSNNVNIRFDFIEGESIILHLDSKGVSASTGSACSSNSLQPSHVLLACGLKKEQIHGSLRLSLGRWTTKEDVNYILEVLPPIVKKLRKISPFKK